MDVRSGRPSFGVYWQAEPGVFLQLVVDGITPGSTAIPLQVANSVARDESSVLEVPVALGWVPDGYNRTGARVIMAAEHGWRAMVGVDNGKRPPDTAGVSVTIGSAADVLLAPTKPGMTGTPVSVRGVTGSYFSSGHLLVALPGDLGLRVAGEASMADLVRVTDALRIGPVPDLSWLGIR